MASFTNDFCVNTYSYTLDRPALACVNSLAERGYGGVELMMYPGHFWPAETDAAKRRELLKASQSGGIRITTINMPNLDLNIAGATTEMRDYSVGLLTGFIRLAGDLETPYVIVGPGKANPLFPPKRAELLGHLRAALDRLCPVAKAAGTRILLENMPFSFLPTAKDLIEVIDNYGNPDIGVIYDVANGHFIGQDPREELRRLKGRVEIVHFSDTRRSVYKHDPIGRGDVPFGQISPVLSEIGYRELPVLEVISLSPDAEILDSARRLAELGYRAARSERSPVT